MKRDVAVIGAGATGLTTAVAVQDAGLSVVVLEARERVGGRLWTTQVDGRDYEIGGQWFSPDQTALRTTLDSLGLETFERYRQGENIYVNADGSARRFSGDIVPVDPVSRQEIERLIGLLDELTATVDPASPWAHPKAQEYDSVSFRSWLEQQTEDAEAIDNVALYVAAAMFTKPAHSFSLLHTLQLAASAGSFSHLVDADFVLDKRAVGGLQQVPLKLAEKLRPEDLRLGHPATRISWKSGGATVETSALSVSTRHVVVAVPPNLYSRIDYLPSLPRLRQQAHQHQSLGNVVKVQATYETAFWRENGLSGTAFSPYQLVHEAYDNSTDRENGGTLVGFVSDVKADQLLRLSETERRHAVLQSLATYYGPQTLEPTSYCESDWAAEEWTQGAYGTSFDIGGLVRYGHLQGEPVGPIRFGSSDLAAEGYMHVDGAIRVGRRIAKEIIAEQAR